eukprot:CAMPEP_0172673848 /NCGR_PEP_ID=MMETSP1074-20121228/12403_1 /TAXON_ID=2916 /ORGANISM="Ceratium fusus, Strain PA161109" /LENGTH=446 /DNA_ID=CAMNT_0013491205 /DNA_START=26 /DNA_END=1366 /DNA_ORIENTATION=+
MVGALPELGVAQVAPPPGLEGQNMFAPFALKQPTEMEEVRESALGRSGEVHAAKADSLWQSAEARFRDIEEQQERMLQALKDEVRRCNQNHVRLEDEKVMLQQSVSALQERVAAAEAALGLNTVWNQKVGQTGTALRGWGTEASPEFPSALKLSPLPDFPLGETGLSGEGKETFDDDSDNECASSPPGPGLTVPSLPKVIEPPGSPRPRPEDGTRLSLSELVGLSSPQPTQQREAGRFEFLSPQQTPVTPRPAATPQRSGTPRQTAQVPPTPPRTPQQLRTPGRMMGALTPMKSPAVPQSPFVLCESGGCAFGFMLRLADGVDVGLDIDVYDSLHVNRIKPGGAIEAWNRQCVGGPSAGKAVMPGDKIVAVNGFSDPEAMLSECREKQMLRFSVVRGEPDCDIPGLWKSTPSTFGGGDRLRLPFQAKTFASSSMAASSPMMPPGLA